MIIKQQYKFLIVIHFNSNQCINCTDQTVEFDPTCNRLNYDYIHTRSTEIKI